MGKDYPPSVSKCLQKLSKMSVREIETEYGFPNDVMAAALKNRSQGEQWGAFVSCRLSTHSDMVAL